MNLTQKLQLAEQQRQEQALGLYIPLQPGTPEFSRHVRAEMGQDVTSEVKTMKVLGKVASIFIIPALIGGFAGRTVGQEIMPEHITPGVDIVEDNINNQLRGDRP